METLEIQRIRQGERLRKIRKLMEKTQGEMAEILEMKQGSLADIERGRNQITTKITHFLVENYTVNANWLLNGLGEMFLSDRSEKVIVCPYFANAGESIEYGTEWLTAPIKMAVPGIDVPSFAFQIRGTSMQPMVDDGDFVICTDSSQYHHSMNNLIDGGIYVIATRFGLYFKKILRRGGRKITLYSLNKIENPPIDLNTNEITEFYLPFRRVTKLDFMHDDIKERINRIEHFLASNLSFSP